MYRKRLARIADKLDQAEQPAKGGPERYFIRHVMQKHHEDFERMALRIAGDDITGYHALMSMSMRDYVRAAEAWLEKVVSSQEMAKKAKKR